MGVYFGSAKLDKVYFGSTSIGKIYYGNTLVFEKNKNLKLYVSSYYEYTSGKYTYYDVGGLLGSWSTTGYVIYCTYKHKYNPDSSVYKDSKIYLVSGTLGASGSKVGSSSSSHASYRQSLTINGLTYYIYHGDSGIGDPIMFVLPGSVVNNYTINNLDLIIGKNTERALHPSSVTNTSYTYTTYYDTTTVTRESNDVLTFTKENGFV